MSGGHRLQTLFELRDQAVDDAQNAWRQAATALASQEAEQRRLSARAQALQAQVQIVATSLGGRTAAAFALRDRFLAQLRVEAQASHMAQLSHSQSALAHALRCEQQSRDALVQAQQELKLLQRHRDNADLHARKRDERRADADVDDWSLGRR